MAPAENMSIVMIGNPKEQYGKISVGTLGCYKAGGLGKNENRQIVNILTQGGSSGSPILDPNGDVIAVIWGASIKTELVGLAVSLDTLTLAQLDAVDLNLGTLAYAAPVPTPQPVATATPPVQQTVATTTISRPTSFGKTWWDNKHDYSYTKVLGDATALQAIWSPATSFLAGTYENNATDQLAQFCMTGNLRYYDRYPLTFAELQAEEIAYQKQWPRRSINIDYANLQVWRIDKLTDCYAVYIPFKWWASNGKVNKSGARTIMVALELAHRQSSGASDYFIFGVTNLK
jgi:hypothetical protein